MPDYKKLKRNWVLSSVRRMSYQKIRLYHFGGYTRNFQKAFVFHQEHWLARMKKGNAFNYLIQDELDYEEKLFRDKFENKSFVTKKLRWVAEKIKKDHEKSVRTAKNIPQNWKNASTKELIRGLENFIELDHKISVHHWVLFNDMENILKYSIEKQMQKKGIKEEETKDSLRKLAEPRLIIPLDMERLSMLRVLIANNKKKGLLKHQKEFAFLPVYDMDYEEYSLKYFQNEQKKLERKYKSKEKIKIEIIKIQKKYANRKRKAWEILRKYRSDKMLQALLTFYASFADFKDRKPYARDHISHYARNLFIEISRRIGFSLTETLFLTENEIVGLLNGKIEIAKKEVEKRYENSTFFLSKGKVSIFTNKADLERIDQILERKKDIKEMSGFPASPGKAKGRATLVISNADFAKFKKGDILVASATRPDFVPLMKKAVAIITDEGGMLSHAAIVSRELKIPCVTGTKFATKALKDGDVVEVDANLGFVKILKRK